MESFTDPDLEALCKEHTSQLTLASEGARYDTSRRTELSRSGRRTTRTCHTLLAASNTLLVCRFLWVLSFDVGDKAGDQGGAAPPAIDWYKSHFWLVNFRQFAPKDFGESASKCCHELKLLWNSSSRLRFPAWKIVPLV